MEKFKSVLILAALAQEEQALLEILRNRLGTQAIQKTSLSSSLKLEMNSIELEQRSISILKTGIGSVNASLAFVLAHTLAGSTRNKHETDSKPKLGFDSVILLGVGGALQSELDVGDLVISTRVLQHDYFYSFDHGDQRIRPGALILSSQEAENHDPEMNADPDLIAWMVAAETHKLSKEKTFRGAILSGNEFVGRVDRKKSIASLLPDAFLVDMEAAGVAQLAVKLNIPFVIAKTVADRLNPDGSIENDFKKCLDAASFHAASALHSLL